MSFGLSSDGFTPKTLDDIKTELELDAKTALGSDIQTSPQSVVGQLIGIFSERLSVVWQLALSVYSASWRDSATGVALDNIGDLFGTYRRAATSTRVMLTLTGTAGTVVPAGTLFANSSGVVFESVAAAVLPATAECVCQSTGAITAPAGSITIIKTPVFGLFGATNPADHFLLGSDIESDGKFRNRQRLEINAQGKSTVSAIRRAVLGVGTVLDCYVFENEQDSVDSQGLPPHSFEVVVSGGAPSTLASTILAQKPAGISTYGSSSAPATDSNGFTKTVFFSRPTNLNIYVKFVVRADEATFPANGADLIKAALAVYGNDTYRVGSEVRASPLVTVINAACRGILELDALPKISLAASPTSSVTIPVSNRQLAVLDTARIDIEVQYIPVT